MRANVLVGLSSPIASPWFERDDCSKIAEKVKGNRRIATPLKWRCLVGIALEDAKTQAGWGAVRLSWGGQPTTALAKPTKVPRIAMAAMRQGLHMPSELPICLQWYLRAMAAALGRKRMPCWMTRSTMDWPSPRSMRPRVSPVAGWRRHQAKAWGVLGARVTGWAGRAMA